MERTRLSAVLVALSILFFLPVGNRTHAWGKAGESAPAEGVADDARLSTTWTDAMNAVKWEQPQPVRPNLNRPLLGGPTSTQLSAESIQVLGRLIIVRRDMGKLAKPRYRESLRFEPARGIELRSPRAGLVVDDKQQAKLLDLLRRHGDTATILTGRLRQTHGRSHDGINTWTRIELLVERSQTLEPGDAAEVAGKLLKAEDQQQFMARITPVVLGSVKVFIEKPVVHPQLKGRYQSKVLLRYRAFNTGEKNVVLPAPGVRLQLDGEWIDCKPTSTASTTIPAGSYASSAFRVYTPATAAATGQAANVETTFALGDERGQVTSAVHAMK